MILEQLTPDQAIQSIHENQRVIIVNQGKEASESSIENPMADYLDVYNNDQVFNEPSGTGRKTVLARSEQKERLYMESPETRNPHDFTKRLTQTAKRKDKVNHLAVPTTDRVVKLETGKGVQLDN